MSKHFTMDDVVTLAIKYKNWGKWGNDDQVGTLNYITPEKIVDAANLVKQGRVISLAIPFDDNGPQTGSFGRFNPIHFMLQDGADVSIGAQDHLPNIQYTDDAVTMPLQCATQWDALAHSSVEVGLLFTTLALVTGSIWARPTWGVWWTWDPVLTPFLILWLVYLGYLLIRSYTAEPDKRARFSAIVGILGSINALAVYLASELWRTIHPDKVIGPAAEENALDPAIQLGILVSFIAILLLFAYTIIFRTRLHSAVNQIGSLRDQIDDLVYRISNK